MYLIAVTVVWIIALSVSVWTTRHHHPRSPFTPTAPGVITLGYFAATNGVNLCPPMWCSTYGFPFAYYRWSDAILVMNGQVIGAGWSWPSLLADVFLGVAAVAFVQVVTNRMRTRANGHEAERSAVA